MRPLPQPPAELVSLLEQLPGCRILMDRDYRVVAANTHYVRCCGAGQAGSVVGRFCYEVSHGYDAPCDRMGEPCPRQAAIASGQLERSVHVHHSATGAEHVEVEITPLCDAGGEPAWFMEHIEQLRPAGNVNDFVGRDPAFLRTLEMINRVASTDTSVLLLGETGSGKEVLARALHDSSRRAGKPFVVVDCAGLTESLFESELFGHERGAFTGAVDKQARPLFDQVGRQRHVVLDEIDDVPLVISRSSCCACSRQAPFRRVGGTEHAARATCRLVAGNSPRPAAAWWQTDRFRADLYYRVSAVPDRRCRRCAQRRRRHPAAGRGAARRAMARAAAPDGCHRRRAGSSCRLHDFPGNVRELRNIVERASLLAGGDAIDVKRLPECVCATAARAVVDDGASTHEASPLLHAEREALRQEHCAPIGGSRRELAARLGLSERTLYRKLRGLADA